MKKEDQEEKDLEKQVREMYTPLSVAKKEIWRRWNDKELRKKVEDYLGGDIPHFLKKEPKSVLVRYVFTPDFEFMYFLDLAKSTGLDYVLPEYSDDKFVAGNSDKYHLARLFFHNGNGKNGGDKITTSNVINFNESEGKKFNEIKTVNGKKFVDFHHELLKEFCPDTDKKIVDFNPWFNEKKKISKKYYDYYLTLFLAHGILFENFLRDKGEIEFTSKMVLPSFKKLEKIFGVKPLIVPIVPLEDENCLYWWCYPRKVEERL
jgi:hypothetical protein